MKIRYLTLVGGVVALLASCRSNSADTSGVILRREADAPVLASKPVALPKAILYKTAGDFADNVPVQMGPDGALISFPAPTDIPAGARVTVFDGGWMLSPVGVTAQSVFTRYTFEEYRALPQVPTPQEIMSAIIPGSAVTATLVAPLTPAEALADTAAVNRWLTGK